MLQLALRRLAVLVPVVFAVITLTWCLIRLAPGNFYTDEKKLPAEIVANIRERYGLDLPWYRQYARAVSGIAQGDFGVSLRYRDQSVNTILRRSIPISFTLAALAYAVALLIGVGSGVLSALKHNSLIDRAIVTSAVLGVTVPTFVLGPLLVLLFSLSLYLLPAARWEGIASTNIILPVLTLSVPLSAYLSRLTRAGMLDVLTAEYIRTARAKGLPETTVIFKHALRTGLLPVVAFTGPALGGLIAGSVAVERIFALPGLGNTFLQAAMNRDEPLILGIVAFIAIVFPAMNLIADLIHALLDPRVLSLRR
jgi:oligopeptide transport system permease protein